jgi:hypothetical protein
MVGASVGAVRGAADDDGGNDISCSAGHDLRPHGPGQRRGALCWQGIESTERYASHLIMGNGTLVGQWIRDLDQEAKLPGVKILEDHVLVGDASTRELWWIAHCRAQGASLLNWERLPRKRLQQPHPLRLWREQYGVHQVDIKAACGISQGMESGLRIPMDDKLEALLNYTGLPAEVFVLPERFLKEHPDFLRKYGRRPKGRGGSGSREDQ